MTSNKNKIMKAVKVLAIVMLAVFSYTAVSASPVIHHHRRHWRKHHRHM
jgi:hypothetical protein